MLRYTCISLSGPCRRQPSCPCCIQACSVSVSPRDTTLERSSLHTALITSRTSAHSTNIHLLCAPRDRATLALSTERSRNTCSEHREVIVLRFLSCTHCCVLWSWRATHSLTTEVGTGVYCEFRPGPTRVMIYPSKMVSHQCASSCFRCLLVRWWFVVTDCGS